VRGSGRVLLMIPGGPADADIFAGIVPFLADRYTVVTYDPRGNSRSELDGPPADWSAELHADDASRLLAAVGREPAYVFGNSAGALVGLALVAQHPEQLRTLVAHQPPATELLPDREHQRAAAREIYDTYRREGVGPAMAKFMAGAGLKAPPQPPGEPDRAAREAMARMGRNVELFLAHGIRQIGAFVPDLAALRDAQTRIVVAGGEEARGQLPYEAGAVLAERLGTSIVLFPGEHGGFITHPRAFADRLHEALAGLS
jgi:pimeloyl-ACP methyl ester carboxylesterase